VAERLLSQLAHVEVLTPAPEESLPFYTQVMGLEESGRDGQSVFLRGWGEFFRGPEELEGAVSKLEQSGQGEGWHDDTPRHGPAYRYRGRWPWRLASRVSG
jgi:catechol 2,3-dioxygenase